MGKNRGALIRGEALIRDYTVTAITSTTVFTDASLVESSNPSEVKKLIVIVVTPSLCFIHVALCSTSLNLLYNQNSHDFNSSHLNGYQYPKIGD